MSQSPTISVLTTVYNRSQFIGECIESLQQSKFQDYEHIIVDDRSSDNSVEIAQRYAEGDSRIKVLVNDKNLGDYPNRNKAASLANGKYIKYLDADDLLGPWMLDIMVDAMETHPQCALGLIDYTDNTLHTAKPLAPREAFEAHYSGTMNIFNRSPLGAILRKDVFDTLGGFSGKRMVGDFEMWHVIAQSYPIVAIPHMLSFYRRHNAQEMSHHRNDPIWAFRYLIISLEQLSHKNCPFDENRRDMERHKVRRHAGRSILQAIRHHGWNKGRQMMDEIGWTPRETWKAAMER